MKVPQKLKIELPYNSTIPLLGMNPKKFKWTYNVLCTFMFSATLFTIAKLYIQPGCPLTWMDKENVVYIHNGVLFSHKGEWNCIICGKMDGTRDLSW
jgi:hypothetical protein